MQTRAADGEDWSDVAIVVKVGEDDKQGELKIVGTEGIQGVPDGALGTDAAAADADGTRADEGRCQGRKW